MFLSVALVLALAQAASPPATTLIGLPGAEEGYIIEQSGHYDVFAESVNNAEPGVAVRIYTERPGHDTVIFLSVDRPSNGALAKGLFIPAGARVRLFYVGGSAIGSNYNGWGFKERTKTLLLEGVGAGNGVWARIRVLPSLGGT